MGRRQVGDVDDVSPVAIYADADAGALHAAMADEAYGLGPGRPAETYLDIEKIIAIAARCGADAVHPGYGFLSERAEFAEAVQTAGLTWVGPSASVIRALGDKVEARRIAAKVGAPLVKGSDGPLADGLPLSLCQVPPPRCHAIEFRINAEDPGRGFLPTPGRITAFRPPAGPGIRLDSGVMSGSEIPSLYDSLMAKLIVTGATRGEALARARRALAEFEVEGVASVIPFHRAVLQEKAFTGEDGFKVHTGWIESEFGGIPAAQRVEPADPALVHSFIEIDGRRHRIALPAQLLSGLALAQATPATSAHPDNGTGVTAPMAGTLLSWLVIGAHLCARFDGRVVVDASYGHHPFQPGRAGVSLADLAPHPREMEIVRIRSHLPENRRGGDLSFGRRSFRACLCQAFKSLHGDISRDLNFCDYQFGSGLDG